LWCTQFWELDTDHDFYITKEDLLRYGNHSLTYRIVDRIFSQVSSVDHEFCSFFPACIVDAQNRHPSMRRSPRWCAQAARPFASNVEGKMSYEDFVWFILSEEDKTSDVSLEYWFRCVDLDCDGHLQPNEMLVRCPTALMPAALPPALLGMLLS